MPNRQPANEAQRAVKALRPHQRNLVIAIITGFSFFEAIF